MKTERSTFFHTFFHTRHFLFPALQLVILCTAFMLWFMNRGTPFQKTFAPQELTADPGIVTAEGIATDSSLSAGGSILQTPPISLGRGIYEIHVNYNVSAEGSSITANTSQLSPLDFHAPSVTLLPERHTAVMTAELRRSVSDFTMETVFSGNGAISIYEVGIFETSHLYKKNLFYAFLLCLLVNLVWLFLQSDTAARKTILALSGIFLAVCYPLYTDYLIAGHDLPFHLLRIEGIAEALKNGNPLPVKIHPFWAKDYGYAVGTLYGDALLYFPAILRVLGFSVQTAYKYFAAAVNLGTVLISYFSFKTMFQSRKTGLLGCLIYSFSLYRLVDTYTRASVGEYCAMMFLPLVLCGFFLAFSAEKSMRSIKPVLLTALGLTGLIQTHVLSCGMAAIIIIPVCIVLIRRVIRPYTFRALAGALLLTILLNMGFLVPFLDYYGSDLNIFSGQWQGSHGSLQANGLFPVQLFSLFQNSNGGAESTAAGIMGEMTPGMGILFLCGILLFCYLLLFHLQDLKKLQNFYPALLCLVIGCLLLYMSTYLFPWDRIASLGGTAGKLLDNLQFPWRFLAFATVLLTFSTCFAVRAAEQIGGIQTARSAALGMLLLLAINCGWYFYDFCFNSEPYRVYASTELNTMLMYSYDYLPIAVNPELIQENDIIPAGIDLLEAYQKHGTEITCHAATDQPGSIDFPLIYYRYYACTNLDTGEKMPVSAGYNGMLHVDFPAGFNGNIRIAFEEPWFWRASELISILTLPAWFCITLACKYVRRQS